MKSLAILVAIFLFSNCATSPVTARYVEPSFSSLRNEELPYCWHYHPFPPFYPKPHWPIPTPGKAFPPIPSGHFHPVPFHPPQVVTKCLADCKDVKTCFADIAKAFFTKKADIGSDCCASIQKMDADCDKTIFGAYHNPFFDCFVKLHCSTKAASTPSAPSPA